MKKVIFTAIGTRGDVRPVIQLARELKTANEVLIVAPPENEKDAARAGVPFLPIGMNFASLVELHNLRTFRQQVALQFTHYHEEYQSADLIVGVSLFFAGRTLAEYFRKPYYHMFYTPQVIPNGVLPPPGARNMTERANKNRMLWKRHYRESNFIYGRVINEQREALGLSPVADVYPHFTDVPVVMMIDHALFDVRTMGRDNLLQVPFAIYESDQEFPEDAARELLSQQGKRALISCGSAKETIKKRDRHYRDLAEALGDRGYRTVIVDKDAFEVPNADFFEYLPFHKVIRDFDLVVHHGGIGTAMQCLLCGVPQIISPQILDQFFWAHLLAQDGFAKTISDPREIAVALTPEVLESMKDKATKYSEERQAVDSRNIYREIFAC